MNDTNDSPSDAGLADRATGSAADRLDLLRACAWRAGAAATLWWLLSEGAGGWYLGLPAVVLAVTASLLLSPTGKRRRRLALLGLLRFALAFLFESVLAGLRVARLAFAPRLALDPAVKSMELRLPPGLPRVLLANTLTLQPGTLAVWLDGDRLDVHVLDAGQPLEKEVRAWEARIGALFREVS